ncbi:translation elongation factor 4 [Anaerolineales bacterium HSG6]|nr:translation elongation factor 4 [Anaerolineales bacterium HSG6]MDM8532354.1 translation elongation factor 4 [Anaerolineales bacterium HSG25]
MNQEKIRNFCIIAHIDHGKSTLADRLLQSTGTISEREMQAQVLDSMDLEREKGVTIKASAVRMGYTAQNGETYQFNLIDTPGHVDFTYEVSRAIAACEGAILVVDATQGIEAQTLANLYLALDYNLEIIAVVNKVDLQSAQPDDVAQEIEDLIGLDAIDVLPVSAKTGIGVETLLEAVVERVPPPQGNLDEPFRALIFDSHYDAYKGVIAYVRVMDGQLGKQDMVHLFATERTVEPLEIGVFRPMMKSTDSLQAGEVGYIATGLKTIRDVRVGDTVALDNNKDAIESLAGYEPVKPMVYAGFYPTEAEDYKLLKDALEKLQLNDASLIYEPETSQALGFGFRVGFLGLFHMEIIQERLEREYDLDLLATAPSVEYQILKTDGEKIIIDNPADMPEPTYIDTISEPWMHLSVYTPADYIGGVMEISTRRRGEMIKMEYLDETRVLIEFNLPLSEMIIDYYDNLKSITKGYASMDYKFGDYRASDLVKLEVLVNKEPVDALSVIVHREQSYPRGQKLVSRLKKVIPRQMFVVPIQAAVGKKVISRANIKAYRKDVTAKCYGGDISRKKKLLQNQAKAKKRMKMLGKVEVPQEAFMTVLRLSEE